MKHFQLLQQRDLISNPLLERGIPSTTGRFCVLEAARSSVGAWLFLGERASVAQCFAQIQQIQDSAHVLWHSACAELADTRLCTRPLAQCMRRFSKCKTFAHVLGTCVNTVHTQSQKKTTFARVLWHSVCTESANSRLCTRPWHMRQHSAYIESEKSLRLGACKCALP